MSAESLKLTAYFGERQRTGDDLVASALLDLYARHAVAASILLRGTEGFGPHHRVRTDSSLSLSEDLPAVAIAVDARERIEALLDEAAGLVRTGLITLERARRPVGEPASIELPEDRQEETKLTVYLSRQERVDGRPAFVALCDLLHRRGVAGATALLGVDGTAHGQRERARFFARNAAVPMMVIAVGAGDRIAGALPEIGTLLRRPLITLERVRVAKRDGVLAAPPPALPETDEHGRPLGQKLTIFTSEAQQHDGRPVHRAIMRALRRSGASGATTLRGLWGFHGDHPPHGDRVLQFGRRVPAVTTVIDTPDRIASAFAVVDELTAGRGLVTSELVPALRVTRDGESRGGFELARYRY